MHTGDHTVILAVALSVAALWRAGLVVISANPDGTPLGGLTWPGVWIVTAQHPVSATRLRRWDNVVIEFEELRGGEEAGDREPRIPLPDPGALAVEMEPPAAVRRWPFRLQDWPDGRVESSRAGCGPGTALVRSACP